MTKLLRLEKLLPLLALIAGACTDPAPAAPPAPPEEPTASVSAGLTTVTFTPSADDTLATKLGGVNGASAAICIHDATVRQAALRFNVSSIPSTREVTSASLVTTGYSSQCTACATAATFQLHRLTAAFTESAHNNVYGASNRPCLGETPTGAALAAGTNYVSTVTQSDTLDAGGGISFANSANMRADVQGWVDGGANYGWVIISATSGLGRILYSSEAAAANRPTLSVTYGLKDGYSCSTGTDCGSGNCVDGVCCNTTCTSACYACTAAKKGYGSNGTCQAIEDGADPDAECAASSATTCGNNGFCNGAGACQKWSAGTVCRAATNNCDVAETCPGGGAACPANAVVSAGTDPNNFCTAQAASTCGQTGSCNGSTSAPGCALYTAGTTCRAATNACDLAETCPGSGVACPADSVVPAGTDPNNFCADQGSTSCGTNGSCNGVAGAAACATYAGGTVCRAAVNGCDVAEACPGGGAACPADSVVPAGSDPNAYCAQAAVLTCGQNGSCDGAAGCQLYAGGTVCRSAANACDVAETCPGSGGACPSDVTNPQPETCNGVDDNCNGSTDEGCDNDGDLFCDSAINCSAGAACACTGGVGGKGGDCNDAVAAVKPGATEVCDNVDNNCAGSPAIDEGCDDDGDDWCDASMSKTAVTVTACPLSGTGTSAAVLDCDDTRGQSYPGAGELCDGLDNDCNGSPDQPPPPTTTCGVGACLRSGGTCVGGVPTGCTPGTPTSETCNGVDDDCNGVVDNGLALATCGVGACAATGSTCNPASCTAGTPGTETCNGIDDDCNGVVDNGCDDDNDDYCDLAMTTVGTPAACPNGGGDCDDTAAAVKPGASEICDNLDNNCAGSPAVDEGCDDDNDNYCDAGMTKAAGVVISACPATPTAGTAGDDCNDAVAAVNPGQSEACNGVDDDCSASADEGCDDDGDAYCDASMTVVGTPSVCPNGGNDCNDALAAVHPGLVEGCNGVDDNCTLGVDEGCDDDNDGYCDAARVTSGTPATCASGGGDCDDTDGAVNPGATEICDNVDNDCNGLPTAIDEGCDDDGDKYCASAMAKAPGVLVSACQLTPAGDDQGDDCDDTLATGAAVHPGVPEICDDLDNDCALGADDGCDDDNDGYCDAGMAKKGGMPVATCPSTPGGATQGDDCVDTVASAHPGGTEVCDGVDDDCNGQSDEGCDDDGDGFCDEAMTLVGTASICPSGGGDCNDTSSGTHPGALEICDGNDNDCNGQDDDAIPNPTCGVGECVATATGCVNGVPQGCTPKPPTTEQCDEKDNDCNGLIDDGLPPATCGLGECAAVGTTCDNDSCQPGTPSPEVCDGKDNDCDGTIDDGLPIANCGVGACFRQASSCASSSCTPGEPLPEVCDGADNDCDGAIDDGLPVAHCGLGACARTGTTCEPSSCTPGAVTGEECNDLDDDCDGKVDNGCDDDGDGYCDAAYTVTGTPAACVHPEPDCDDDKASVHPTADELCNDRDDDCDGTKDDSVANPTCGIGGCMRIGTSCANGVAENCTPGPAADEACNGLDDDCDDLIDEDVAAQHCGVGECEVVADGCVAGVVPVCTPRDPGVETCNGRDDDCNGAADDGELCGAGRACVAGACVLSSDGGVDAGVDGSAGADAGGDAAASGGSAGAGGSGNGTASSGDDSGCGCRAVSTVSTNGWIASLALVAAWARRRRGARRALSH